MMGTPPIFGTSVNLPAGLVSGNLNLSTAIAKTITFRKAGSDAVHAKKCFIHLVDTAPAGVERLVHVASNTAAGASHFVVTAGDYILTIEHTMASLSFYLETAGDSVTAYVWAFGDEDMSGTTSA